MAVLASGIELTAIKTHALLVTFGGTVVGPCRSTPTIEAQTATNPVTIYETGAEAVMETLQKNEANVTIETDNVDWALTQLAEFEVGSDVLAAANKKTLLLTPINGDAAAKTLTFTDAYLMPGLSYVPDSGAPHYAKLVFRCVPNATTKKLYTWA